MFECWWQDEGFEAWHLRGDLRGASRRWQHRLQDELWLWFNAAGEGVVWGKDHRIFLKPGLFGCFGGQESEDWKWTRLPGHHEGEILIIPRDWLLRHAGDALAKGRTPLARFLRGESGISFAGLSGPLEKRLARWLGRGWKSGGLPRSAREALEAWLTAQAAPSTRSPRATARGRQRTSAKVSSTNDRSYHSQSSGGIK